MKNTTLNQTALIKSRIDDTNSPETFFDKLITKRRLAELLSVSESFINKLMKNEGLPHRALGRAVRFSVKEVMAWLQTRSKP